MTNSSDSKRTSREPSAEEPAAGANAAAEAPPSQGASASGANASGANASGAAADGATPAEDAGGSSAESETLRGELDALREEQQETNDRLLRTAAELRNVRRRAAEEQRRRSVQSRASALRPMLEVLDDLQRALAAADDDGAGAGEGASGEAGDAFQALRSGVGMVEEKFERALAGLGVEPIAAEGEPFDETLHEAMMQQPAPEGTAPGTVLAEVRRGYRMAADDEERVLRHSRVVVAVEPESSSAGEDGEGNEASKR